MIFEIRLTVLCLILSIFVSAAYAVRIWFRKDVRYDVVSEWLGHGLHGLGMTYMSYVMLGAIPAFIPFMWLAVFFGACTFVFAARITLGLYYLWWWDVLHVIGSAAMAYMFFDNSLWRPWLTVAFMLYYLAVIVIYIYYTKEHTKIAAWRTRFAQQLSNSGHLAMSVAMILMLAMMQWPIGLLIDNIACTSTQSIERIQSHGHHKH